jgi:hypothetical protein
MIILILEYNRGQRMFAKSRSQYKSLDARRVTRSKLHTEDRQTLGATVQNAGALANVLVPGTFHLPIYIICPEDNGSKFLRIVAIFPPNYSGLRFKRGGTLRLRQGEVRIWREFSKLKK